jgi:hypothetical protein
VYITLKILHAKVEYQEGTKRWQANSGDTLLDFPVQALHLVQESHNRLLHRHIPALPVAIVTTPPADST